MREQSGLMMRKKCGNSREEFVESSIGVFAFPHSFQFPRRYSGPLMHLWPFPFIGRGVGECSFFFLLLMVRELLIYTGGHKFSTWNGNRGEMGSEDIVDEDLILIQASFPGSANFVSNALLHMYLTYQRIAYDLSFHFK
jgi:hypothetical protein